MADYGVRYRLDFCNVLGVKQRIDICKRDYNGAINPLTQFTGGGNPISISFKNNDEDNKFSQITGSEATVRIISNPSISLNTFFSEDERMWRIDWYAGDFAPNIWNDALAWNDILSWVDYSAGSAELKWTGYLMPDSSSEPFQHIYEFEIKAKDVLGTLKTVPYANEDTTLIKKVDSLKNILIECLNKTGLSLNTVISTETFEHNMAYASDLDCPLEQTYVDTNRFIDTNGNPYSCYDVIMHICNEFSANIKQANGKWYFIDITQFAKTTFKGVEFGSNKQKIGAVTINANKEVQPDQLVNKDAGFTTEPGYKTVSAYYQYGYLGNKVPNGDFNMVNPVPMAQRFPNWTQFGDITVGYGQKFITTPTGNVNIPDYYAIINNKGLSSGFYSDPVPVLVTNTIRVSVYVRKRTLDGNYSKFYRFNTQLKLTGAGQQTWYWSGNAQRWVTTQAKDQDTFVQLKLGINDFLGGTSASYSASFPPYEGNLTLVIFGVENEDEQNVEAIIDDAEIALDEGQYYKSPIGYVTQVTNLGNYSKTPDPIVLIFGDDTKKDRTSWMRNSVGEPTEWWLKRGDANPVPKNLQTIVAENILSQHRRPSRRFEGSLRGDFSQLDTLRIPLTEGKFMFLSGTLEVKSATFSVVASEIFTEEFDNYIVNQFLDTGEFKKADGSNVGSSAGVSITPVQVGGANPDGLIQNQTEEVQDAEFNIKGGMFDGYLAIPSAPPASPVAGKHYLFTS